jgi:small-conductance mechanosensitive channel
MPILVVCRAVLALLLFALALPAMPTLAATSEARPPEATLAVANREVVVFRATVLGYTPAVRVERTLERIAALGDSTLDAPVKTFSAMLGEVSGVSIYVGDQRIFTLVGEDLDPEDKMTLQQAAEQAGARLAAAFEAKREQRRLPVVLTGIAHMVGVTVVLGGLFWAFVRVGRVFIGRLERRSSVLAVVESLQWREYLVRLVIQLLQLLRWVLLFVLGYGWITYVLEHFPLTEPLGRRLVRFVMSLLTWLVDGLIASAPGIATVLVILAVARAIVGVLAQFFDGVQTGRTKVPVLHPETVSATRRIVMFIAWTLALVVAYPFIPGSNSDIFKGFSVLFGVMLSLGSTSLVTQMMSGLVIVYSRALRKGDFVVVDAIEGVVLETGTLATKIVTMRNEEITIPNAVLIGTPIRNYSKLAGEQGTLLSTKVTIGYDAPWRQVHALLELAAARTGGLRREPKPFVYQRALSDYYVEYELFAHIDHPLQRVATLSALHASIQDAFNEHGVQIMSPHFVLQPDHAVVVPPEAWHAKPAPPPKGHDD